MMFPQVTDEIACDNGLRTAPCRSFMVRTCGIRVDLVRAGEIVVAVEALLRQQHRGRRTVYRREWSIGVGATRVDMAAINGRIIGCEIKSARDNFGRLPSQVQLYSAVLDTAVLAVEGSNAAERARDLLPNWWGIWMAQPTSRGAVLDVIREPGPNPSPDPLSIAQLLWRDEAYSVLDRRGLSGGLRKATRWRLWEALAGQLQLHELQHEVRDAIKARPEW
jgi:hypothetical protein